MMKRLHAGEQDMHRRTGRIHRRTGPHTPANRTCTGDHTFGPDRHCMSTQTVEFASSCKRHPPAKHPGEQTHIHRRTGPILEVCWGRLGSLYSTLSAPLAPPYPTLPSLLLHNSSTPSPWTPHAPLPTHRSPCCCAIPPPLYPTLLPPWLSMLPW